MVDTSHAISGLDFDYESAVAEASDQIRAQGHLTKLTVDHYGPGRHCLLRLDDEALPGQQALSLPLTSA